MAPRLGELQAVSTVEPGNDSQSGRGCGKELQSSDFTLREPLKGFVEWSNLHHMKRTTGQLPGRVRLKVTVRKLPQISGRLTGQGGWREEAGYNGDHSSVYHFFNISTFH